MHVIHRRGWEIPESRATPEHLFFNRRAFLGTAGAAAATTLAPGRALAQRVADLPDPTASLYPFKLNEKYKIDRAITPAEINGAYNNFYEFVSSKPIANAAEALKLRPGTMKMDGMVQRQNENGFD